MPEIKEIPLHDFHAQHGARFVDFGGWNMPVQYTSILDEHRAVREDAGLFDVSHMGEFLIQGGNAGRFLNQLLVNQIAEAADGKAIYSPMCAEDGSVVDDLLVYRVTRTEFLVCVNASNIEKDLAWFRDKAEEWQLDLEIADQSDHYSLLAVQGPKSEDILKAAGFDLAAGIKRFNHQSVTKGGVDMRICRTGYTGEDGFEIYVPPSAAQEIAEAILAAGTEYGLKLCGLGARDSLRLEAGLPLYGHEISNEITPLEAGLGWTVKFEKPEFVGKEALAKQKEYGLKQKVIFFKLEGRRIAREGTEVICESGEIIGRVLSGTLSPITGSPIGSALISTGALDALLYVDLRGNKLPLKSARPPLHK
ncbi:MAG: glycine cleavage system aminomethyltransferase GcvT [Opitutales bacterium]